MRKYIKKRNEVVRNLLFLFALLAIPLFSGATGVFAEELEHLVLFDDGQVIKGKVEQIEKYGHARLDISIDDFNNAGFALGDIVTVSAGSYEGDMPYINGYYVERGEYMLRAFPGDSTIAVCINYGKFAETAGIEVGDPVTIKLKESAGALTLQEIITWYSPGIAAITLRMKHLSISVRLWMGSFTEPLLQLIISLVKPKPRTN